MSFKSAEGSIKIEPALNWFEIQQIEKGVRAAHYVDDNLVLRSLELVIDTETVHTAEGTMIKKSCSRMEAHCFDADNWYLIEEMEHVLKLFPEKKFSGVLNTINEDTDFEKGTITGVHKIVPDNKTHKMVWHRPAVTWPTLEEKKS